MDMSNLESIINNLQTGESTTTMPTLFDPIKLLEPLMPYIIITTVLFGIFAILYLISLIDRWRANRAIIEIRNTLREMNTRDKAPAEATERATLDD